MKLSKLYCNISGFKNIEFNLNGINVIYADVVSQSEEKKNSHDLGKTKLAELIDFLFLKSIDKHHFLLKILDETKVSVFINHIFYLELLLNNGQYLTIKRPVKNNTKISFSINEQRIEAFKSPAKWDYENITFQKAKDILSEILSIDFFKNKDYDFRKAINYSIRMQGDYEDAYKLSKYVGGADTDWKPFMFDLLGFDGKLLQEKYANDKQREDIKTFIDNLKREYAVKTEDRDDLVAQLKLIEKNSQEVEKQVDSFNFFEKDKQLITKSIEEVESEISDLNTNSYNLNYEIDRLQKSIKNNFAFDLNKVNKIFEESQIYFSEQLKENYSSLIDFNTKLTVERNKLLKQALGMKEIELKAVNLRLSELNDKKEEYLSYLQDTDTFKRFKFYQKELVKIEGESLRLRERISTIDKIFEKEKDREKLLKEIEGTVGQLKEIYAHTENNSKYSDIRGKFSDYYEKIMDENARISWNINTNNNVEFIPPKVQTKGVTKKDTAKDEGRTYKKILCVAFDLAILSSYNTESYFRFVYHDDVLSQQDNGIKRRLLELVAELSRTNDLQYILSCIKSDLPLNEQDQPIFFSESDIVLKLHDKNETGTLFGFEF